MNILKFMNYKQPKSFLGVDINSNGINLVELSYSKQKFCLENYANIDIPVDKNLLATTLKSALEQINVKTRAAALAMPNALVMTKNIQLDRSLSANEIYEHIKLQSMQYFGNSAEELCWDFNILGISKNNSRQQDVCLVAVRKNEMRARIAVLEMAGLEVKAVDVESFALARVRNFLKLRGKMLMVHCHPFGFLLENFATESRLHVHEKNWQFAQQDLAVIAEEVEQELHLLVATDQCFFPEQILLSASNLDINKLQELLQLKLQLSVVKANPFSLMHIGIHEKSYQKNLLDCVLSCGIALWNFV